MSVYAIGDIHGCFNALRSIFEIAPLKPEDTIVFLGDYIDRGPQSRQTIQWIIDLGKKHNVVTLRGNHELMMINSQGNGHVLSNWLYNGGANTLDSYEIGDEMDWYKRIPETHWGFINGTKKYYSYNDFIFVHAGLTPGIELEEQTESSIFWEHRFDPKPYADNKIVVCGHTPQKGGKIGNFGHTLCIDTYAFGGQWLTCLDVTTGLYYQGNEKGQTNLGECRIGS